MEPKVIFEDEQIVVLDKPSGLMMHASTHAAARGRPLLTDWLEKRYEEFFLVHRIDAETSGVVVVAKTKKAFEFLKAQFKNREVKKVYRAFVYGALKDDRGVIDKPVGNARGGRGPRSAKKPYGTLRDAVTMYRRIKNGTDCSYVEIFPKTGRTHQIRVHFAAIQHPVVADKLYAPTRAPLLGFDRLALHALSLSIKHPNGKDMIFTAPLPEDFARAERQLQKA